MDKLPSGRVTFLFTDLEGSTRYWERAPEAMPSVYARHDAIIRDAVERQAGIVYKVTGDAFQAAFPNPQGALAAAIKAQQLLQSEEWPLRPAPRVRMALHVVDVSPTPDGDYRTPGLNRLGRLLSAADGGQILLSESLVGELDDGLDPGFEIADLGLHQFRDLSPQRVFQAFANGLAAERAALRALTPHHHNLPQPTTAFIGRADDIKRGVRELLDPTLRILTLTGPGGIGKTRLAIEMAGRVLEQFSGGVWFVSLTTINAPDLVLPAIAATLGVRESVDETIAEALIARLAERRSLLLLDNMEQVVGAAPHIGALVARCPSLSLLVTSRIPLQIAGEQELSVEPFHVAERDSSEDGQSTFETALENDAVRLFADRTRAVLPAFAITSENIGDVVSVCQQLDGVPLAIELAAARGRLLPPAKLLERLQSRLPLLSGGPRDAPVRHQTLRATIDWSYELLSPEEKSLFARLAVFTSGASLEAIEGVWGGVIPSSQLLDTVESLVRQSLLVADADRGLARVRMLETIREYAWEKLNLSGHLDDARSSHATYFRDLVENAEAHLSGPDQIDWLDLLSLEQDNLRAALRHFENTERLEDLAQMSGALWRFWWVRGHLTEGREWLERAMRSSGKVVISELILARVYDGAGALAEAQGEIDRASDFHERAYALWQQVDDRLGQARSLENLGIIALHDRGDIAHGRELHNAALDLFMEVGDRPGIASSLKNLGDAALSEELFPEASTYYTRALVVARGLNDIRGIAAVLTSLGALAFFLGDTSRAIELYGESLPLWRRLDDKPGLALTLGNLGEALDHSGDIGRAQTFYEESLALARDLDDRQGIAFALSHLGRTARHRGEFIAAARFFVESADVSVEIDDHPRLAESVEGLAGVLADTGEFVAAARLYGLARHVRETTNSPMHSIHLPAHTHDMRRVDDVLGHAAFAELMTEGASTPLDAISSGIASLIRDIPHE